MSTQYLTADHKDPGQFIRHGDMLIPRGIYEANPADYGVVVHRTADGTPPYTDWVEQPDGSFSRDLLGTEEERAEAALAAAKSGKYQERLDALLAARNAGFAFNSNIVDSDQDSRILISGAVQLATLALMQGTQEALAQFAAGLGAGWRYRDGTIAATDAASMIALGQALAGHIAYCDAVSQAHKAAIEACTTADECNVLDVTAGYPA